MTAKKAPDPIKLTGNLDLESRGVIFRASRCRSFVRYLTSRTRT